MRRFTVGASLVLALFIPTVAPARQADYPHPRCPKTFTVRMGERAGRAIYRGTRDVTERNLRLLGRIEMCQRNPAAQGFVRWYDRHQAALWRARRDPPFSKAVASWYDDGGQIACHSRAYYGVANRTLPCGTNVTFRYGGRTVTATVDDRGPYINGRDWDLNQNTAGALGFDGVQTVWYRIG